jgi:uncharacterized membrane protein
MNRLKVALRFVLSAVMLSIGALHFLADDLFAQIVPPALPAPYVLVWLSGLIEMLLGIGILFVRTRRLAGFGLVLLYLAVFPANIYMAVANVQMRGLPSWLSQPSPAALWMRLPFQLAFIGWALWVGEIWPSQITQSDRR